MIMRPRLAALSLSPYGLVVNAYVANVQYAIGKFACLNFSNADGDLPETIALRYRVVGLLTPPAL